MALALSPSVRAIARNIDVMPPAWAGGVELFGSLTGSVPNDGAFHLLAEPAGFAPLQVDPTYRIIIRYVRAEWSTVDLSVPPPLTLRLFVNRQTSIAFQTLEDLPLLAVEINTPAIDRRILAIVQPGATLTAAVRNTGTVSQQVNLFLTGWAYPQTTPDGAGYEP